MSLLNQLKNKVKDAIKDPNTRAKIEKFAKDNNITLNEAKKRISNHGSKRGK